MIATSLVVETLQGKPPSLPNTWHASRAWRRLRRGTTAWWRPSEALQALNPEIVEVFPTAVSGGS